MIIGGKNEKFIEKIVCTLIIFIILVFPTFAATKSYKTTFNFICSVEGPSRSFESGKIDVVISSTEYLNGCRSGITTFGVYLYKKSFIFSTEVGQFNAARNGITVNGWKNMSSGDYYILLMKANDQARLKGDLTLLQ